MNSTFWFTSITFKDRIANSFTVLQICHSETIGMLQTWQLIAILAYPLKLYAVDRFNYMPDNGSILFAEQRIDREVHLLAALNMQG